MSLVVYKSSAGSGKTTTLVNEYLKIALSNPGDFRHILAITFTNKAANEMKGRVIETLQELTDETKPPSQKLSYLITSLNLDKATLLDRSQKLLSLIIHNYDEFAISTIDSFIHRVIRTFATDVQLPQNFEVVIDDDEIIPDIIQNLYEKVGTDKELTKVLIDFVLSQADEENSYDPTSKLVSFIQHHMHEDGFHHISKLDNLNIAELGEIIRRLKKKINSERSKIIENAKKALILIESNNLEIGDFYGGKNGIAGYFTKIKNFNVPDDNLFPGKTVKKTFDEDSWFSSKSSTGAKESIKSIISELTDYYNKISETIRNYFFHRLLYSKIYSLALVHEIKNLFGEFTEQTGKVHISEFNKKISSEIADQPIPFIYERLGRRYRYFLIDEFQDTSILQWHNLLPLIEESLSYGNFNMLVGDAKQAIYRFRNGEVDLFASLPDLHGNDGSQLALERQKMIHREYEEKILSTNWRSRKEIINFNNDFFKTIIEPLSDKTKLIFDNHEQIIPDNNKGCGFVSLNFIAEDEEAKYTEQKFLKIQSFIEDLKLKGTKEKDICILCRAGKNAIAIAGFLLEMNYNVVSSESLLLINSPKVRLIIAFLKLMVYPENQLALAEFLENYLTIVSKPESFNDEFIALQRKGKSGIDVLFDHLNISTSIEDILSLSTYEITEFIVRDVIHQDKADVFIQYLMDFILETKLPLDEFVNRWEDKKEKLFITMPDDLDAIQVMTIHKAKGLDFNVVIVDAANNKNSNTKTEYWEDLDMPDFKELKVGLFPLNSKLEHINKGHIYDREVTKTELDFLNLIYVAFTRPKKALFTIAQIKSGNRIDKFADYMIFYLKNKGLWQEDKMNYNFGKLEIENQIVEEKNDEILKLSKFISTRWQDLVSVAFSDDIIKEALVGTSSRSYGKLIHKILSEIEYKEDVLAAINTLKLSGLIDESNLNLIEDVIDNVITHPELSKYYQSDQIIKNETEIMLNTGEIVRPDRVVIKNNVLTIIDYKTGEEKQQDHDQLAKYRDAFSEIGYKEIDAIIVYIGDIIKVVSIASQP